MIIVSMSPFRGVVVSMNILLILHKHLVHYKIFAILIRKKPIE